LASVHRLLGVVVHIHYLADNPWVDFVPASHNSVDNSQVAGKAERCMAAGSSEGSLHSLEVVIEVVGPNVSVCGILLRFGVSLWESFLMRVKIPRTLEVVFRRF
jgi:hypothetical protein